MNLTVYVKVECPPINDLIFSFHFQSHVIRMLEFILYKLYSNNDIATWSERKRSRKNWKLWWRRGWGDTEGKSCIAAQQKLLIQWMELDRSICLFHFVVFILIFFTSICSSAYADNFWMNKKSSFIFIYAYYF